MRPKVERKARDKTRCARNIHANWKVKCGGKPVVRNGPRYICGIQLHVVLVIARQVHKVNSKPQLGCLDRFSATSEQVI